MKKSFPKKEIEFIDVKSSTEAKINRIVRDEWLSEGAFHLFSDSHDNLLNFDRFKDRPS